MSLTTTDFSQRFGQAELLALTDPLEKNVQQDVFNAALQDAMAEIELYFPQAVYPSNEQTSGFSKTLKSVLADLTRARLYGDTQPDTVKKRADEARILLRSWAEKKSQLRIKAPTEIFSTQGLKGF